MSWATVEVILCKLGVSISGYTECQMSMYEVYEPLVIEMGGVGGFGEGWPGWLKILVTSTIHLVVFAGLSFFMGKDGAMSAAPLMKALSGFLVGGITPVHMDENGVPMPGDFNINLAPGIALNAGNMGNMFGNIVKMFTGNIQQAAQQAATDPVPPPPPPSEARTGRQEARRRKREQQGNSNLYDQ